LIRTGKAIQETVDIVKELGAEVIGCGAIVRFEDAPAEINGIKFNRSPNSTVIFTTRRKNGNRLKEMIRRRKPSDFRIRNSGFRIQDSEFRI
jgi:orotate phosphoribosyltransferase